MHNSRANTRRVGPPQSPFVVGRRRPPLNSSFTSGGQLNLNQPPPQQLQRQKQHSTQPPHQHQLNFHLQPNKSLTNQARNQPQAGPSNNKQPEQQNPQQASTSSTVQQNVKNLQAKKDVVAQIPNSGSSITPLPKPLLTTNSEVEVTSVSSSSSSCNDNQPTSTTAVTSTTSSSTTSIVSSVQQSNNVENPQQSESTADNTTLTSMDTSSDEKGEATETDDNENKNWFKNRGTVSGRITKAEKLRRRNLRLSKILQPKSAIIILNELVRGTTYTVVPCTENKFQACVHVDGQTFTGSGRTKMQARNEAAEVALKFIIQTKHLEKKNKSNENDGTAMEQDDEDAEMEIQENEKKPLPWSHIASFAMFKLLTSWGSDPTAIHNVEQSIGENNSNDINCHHLQNSPTDCCLPKDATTSSKLSSNSGELNTVTAMRLEPKPAKKMPENPERLNPLMLLHQMVPTVIWEEHTRRGMPPNAIFTFKLTANGRIYTGEGLNKKAAKTMAAYAACHDLLYVNYPPEVWTPTS